MYIYNFIILIQVEEDVAKYYIGEETDEKEKVNFIIKNGYTIQKSAVTNFV